MTAVLIGALAAENALFHTVGEIFQPIFRLFANILAFIYGIVPNYAIAIILLTVLVMAVFTPLTVKSTKSMLAMQELQPEIKKLQQKYKGAENREQLNREMMALYKEKGVSPVGGCLPFVIQMPFLFVLYDVIRGLTATNAAGNPQPDYISHSSLLYQNLVHSGGKMMSFGMDLALKPFSHHSSVWAAIPYFALVIIAVGLQYLQMSQMTKRNPQAAKSNKQMQMMQKVMPIFFAYIYFLVPAAVVIYMIVSTLIRIGTQDVIFRTGIVEAPGKERALPSGSAPVSTGGVTGALRRGLSGAIPAKSTERRALPPGDGEAGGGRKRGGRGDKSGDGAAAGAGKGKSGGEQRPSVAGGKPTTRKPRPGTAAARGTSGNGNGKGPSGNGTAANGAGSAKQGAKPHPRSKDKRTRKAR